MKIGINENMFDSDHLLQLNWKLNLFIYNTLYLNKQIKWVFKRLKHQLWSTFIYD